MDYQVADLLALPPRWQGAFDLVAEVYTVQALFGPAREAAIDPRVREEAAQVIQRLTG